MANRAQPWFIDSISQHRRDNNRQKRGGKRLQLMTRGELARVDSTLEKLLGCLSTSFEQTVEKMLTNKEAGAKATPFYKTEVMKT
ncbi:unnamed protein product [Didymodactylos carnosus]|uniref:Uncharacterized protein n=1 Tax=Didymodactylos carnosus TaxID=1234261 RepID=A0A8S2ED14_9BILA|nr:unnamed protein product [Didymodactylos carnosus]CAF3957661.1 unnamed protein product [Didymodactylos carnosus]